MPRGRKKSVAPEGIENTGEGAWLSGGIRGWGKGRNINTLEVPDALRNKFQTGLNFVDLALGGIVTTGKRGTDSAAGGLTPSSVIVFTGMPGSGKSTLVQMLANDVTRNGGIALFNSREESLYQIRLQAERLDLKKGFIAADDVFVEDITAHVDHLREKNPGKQVVCVIDSLQTVATAEIYGRKNIVINGSTPMRVMKQLVNHAKADLDCEGNTKAGRVPPIYIVIGHVTKSGHFAGKESIIHLSDAHMHLTIDDAKRSDTFGYRLFNVGKNRFGSAGITYVLDMGPKGLIEMGDISSQQSDDGDDD